MNEIAVRLQLGHSFLRAYHGYMEIWSPVMGEILVYGLEVPCVYRLYGPNIYVDYNLC